MQFDSNFPESTSTRPSWSTVYHQLGPRVARYHIYALIAPLLAFLLRLTSLYLRCAFTRQNTLIGMVLTSAIYETGIYHLSAVRHIEDISFLRREG